MAYQIRCLKCEQDTWAGNIVELIEEHTNLDGRLVCGHCEETETYVDQITGRWEKEPEAPWVEYIKGVIRLAADGDASIPYVFLTAHTVDGEVTRLRFGSYRDARPTGRLADGPGPGEAPALTPEALRQLVVKLDAVGVLSLQDVALLA